MKQRGFTLVELMIVVAILGVLTVLVVWGIRAFFLKSSQAYLREEATEWAAQLGYDIRGVACVEQDTDNDGYVSCTLIMKNDDNRPLAIECAREGVTSLNRGCRLQKAQVNSNGRR